MKYQRFEQTVLILGGAVFFGSLAITALGATPGLNAIVAQTLLFLTLVAAVRLGRRGGTIAALIASAVFVAVWVLNLPAGPIPVAQAVILAARLLSFALVGIVGGEFCSRFKYALTTIEGVSALDEWSRVYNQAYVANALSQGRARFQRYGEPFSVVEVTVSSSIFEGMQPKRARSLVRGVADHIRTDIRMVDEVGRTDDGRFIVLLPHTPPEGGAVVCERLGGGVRRSLGASDASVKLRCVGLPGNEPDIDGLISSLTPVDQDSASGE